MDAARDHRNALIPVLAILLAVYFTFTAPTAGRGAAPATATPATPQPDTATQLRRAIVAVLPPDTGRGAIRLPRVSIDPTGDTTVVVALRTGADGAVIRNAALTDTMTILCAVYRSPVARRVRTVTVIGTYAITDATSTRELPVLRAVLSAQRAAMLDWAKLQPGQLPRSVDLWWIQPAFAAATGLATPAA